MGGQQIHKKTLSIRNHQGNKNENHNDVSLVERLLSKRQKN